MIILPLHILVASFMTVSMGGVLLAAHNQTETKFYSAMLVSFAMTVISGVGLLFVTAGTLGRICATMSVFTVSVLAVRYYYRKQLVVANSL